VDDNTAITRALTLLALVSAALIIGSVKCNHDDDAVRSLCLQLGKPAIECAQSAGGVRR
jgi:hypothetical protein